MFVSQNVKCVGCELYDYGCKAGSKFTEVEGKGGLGVMVVAEASGEAENITGLPLRPEAPSGGIFEKAIKRMGLTRDQFYVTNILRCRPPRNWLEGAPYERAAIERCESNLRGEIERRQPRAIVALGGVALRELTGLSGGKRSVSYVRGYALPSRYGIPVVATFHPAFIARGQSRLLGLVMQDISLAVSIAQGRHEGVVYDPKMIMECRTSYDDLLNLYEIAKANSDMVIAYDLETGSSAGEDEDAVLQLFAENDEDDHEEEEDNETGGASDAAEVVFERGAADIKRAEIRTIQFAIDDRWGVSVPWQGGFIDLATKILSLPNPKAGHNVTWFDRPVLKRHGVDVLGREDDTMVMYRVLQADLPAHLQTVAGQYGWPFIWKHLAGSDIEFYGVADVCSVIRIMKQLPNDLKRFGLWDGYETYTRKFRERVLSRLCETKGIPIDVGRLDEFRDYLNTEIERMDEEIQDLAPDELKAKKFYSNMPPRIKEFVLGVHPELFAPTIKTQKNGVVKEIKSKTKVSDVYKLLCEDQLINLGMKQGCEYGSTLAEVLNRWPDMKIEAVGEKLFQQEPFNPGSSKQMLEYIKFKGYPVPTRFKDGAATTADKELLRLEEQTKDPIIKLAREMRVVSKMRNSYTGKPEVEGGKPVGGWIPDSDGRLRATFTFKSTWQLAASKPNVLTTPKRRKEMARRFRRCIKAEPGYRIIEFDYRAFHAKTTGLEAKDSSWMRLSDLDIHSYVTGHLVRWPGIEMALEMTDGDLKQLLDTIKSKHKDVRDFKAKPSILGIGFGMGARRLYFENRESFSGEAEAKRLLDLIRKLFPKVFAWQDYVVDLADKQGFLQSKWGARRWFWDCFTWKKDYNGQWRKSGGKDAEKAKAFLPANDAHGMLRHKLLEMDDKGWLDDYGFILPVHDALIFHCLERLVDRCLEDVGWWMQSPVIQLRDEIVAPEGFTCAVEAKVGEDWDRMDEVRL